MLSEVMKHFGFKKEFHQAGYFETKEHQRITHEIKTAIRGGRLIVVTGIVGCGKTTMLRQIQEVLNKEKEIIVAKSLAVDKDRVNLKTLILAMFLDLAKEKGFKVPSQPEKRERKLQELVRKAKKPVALFVDEAHDLHPKTLVGLKRLMEVTEDGGGILSILLVGHPKLKNELNRAALEEVGTRTSKFSMDGMIADKRDYIHFLLEQCLENKREWGTVITAEAIDLLAERLATPLQVGHYLTLALEEAFLIGGDPVTPEVVQSVLAKDLDDLGPRLTRYGYNAKVLANMFHSRPSVIRAFLRGQLSQELVEEMRDEMLAAGLPL